MGNARMNMEESARKNGKIKENGRYKPQLPEDFRDVTVRD